MKRFSESSSIVATLARKQFPMLIASPVKKDRPDGGPDHMITSIVAKWFLGAWFAGAAAVVASSVSMNAKLSTSVLLLVIGVAPAVVMSVLKAGAASPTVAEILHSVKTKDSRS
jgi:hypothetical protein